VKTNVRRWLPAILHDRTRSALLGIAALAVIGGAVATGAAQGASTTTGSPAAASVAATDKSALVRAADKASGPTPASASSASAAAPARSAAAVAAKAQADAEKAAADKAAAEQAAAAKTPPPAQWWLTNSEVEPQPNYYYCGPAATRIALSAHGKAMDFDQVAQLLGTTESGTNSAFDVTRVLNKVLGGNNYHTTEIKEQAATPQEMDKLQADIVHAVSHGDVVVANIAGTVLDTDGAIHSYEGGHYLTVIGYSDQGRMARIGDPASPDKPTYSLSTIDLANWIATRGYSS
jgi:hypothetical protein